MNASTMQQRSRWVKESARKNGNHSDQLRVQSIRDESARLMRDVFPRARKVYAIPGCKPAATAKRLSRARKTGGAVADVKLYMAAEPKEALRIAHDLLAFARSLRMATDTRPLKVVLCEEQRADSREDESEVDLLAEENEETLERYIIDSDKAMAALQAARDAATKRLAEIREARRA